jgi:small-conductance mechanosensitive channel/CRP-like cAMP-binding protein
MTPIQASVVAAAVVLLGLSASRSLSRRVHVTLDALCFALISTIFVLRGAPPVFGAGSPVLAADDAWLRVVAALWWACAARLVVALLWAAFHRSPRSREERLFFDLTAAAIYTAAALIVVNSVMELSVRGLLATSGIAAIVLGLAMQNTLSDVFSGIAVGIEAPFTVGDRISVGENCEGEVIEVNWRSIHVRTDSADVAIVPNSVIAKANLINRSRPSPRRTVSIEVACPVSADPDRVVDALRAAAMLCTAVQQSPSPAVFLSHIGTRKNTFTIVFSIVGVDGTPGATGALLSRAYRQLAYDGLLEETPPISRAALLRNLLFFDSLDSKQIDRVSEELQERVVEPGEVLFRQGAAAEMFYIVVSGVINITLYSSDGTITAAGAIGSGDYVGAVSLAKRTPYSATATAALRARVLGISRSSIGPLLDADPELTARLERLSNVQTDAVSRDAAGGNETGGAGEGMVDRIRGFFHVA